MLQTDLTVFNVMDGRVQHCFDLHRELTLLYPREVIHGEEVKLLRQVSGKLIKLSHHAVTETRQTELEYLQLMLELSINTLNVAADNSLLLILEL